MSVKRSFHDISRVSNLSKMEFVNIAAVVPLAMKYKFETASSEAGRSHESNSVARSLEEARWCLLCTQASNASVEELWKRGQLQS